MQTKVSQSYKPTVRLTSHCGWYQVQSGTNPSVYYETSANSCTCPAYRPCKHMRFVRSLNVAFFAKKEAEDPVVVPMTAGSPSGIVRAVMSTPPIIAGLDAEIADAEWLLAIKLLALADVHPQSDEYATLLRQVDQAERQVAALSYSIMRAA